MSPTLQNTQHAKKKKIKQKQQTDTNKHYRKVWKKAETHTRITHTTTSTTNPTPQHTHNNNTKMQHWLCPRMETHTHKPHSPPVLHSTFCSYRHFTPMLLPPTSELTVARVSCTRGNRRATVSRHPDSQQTHHSEMIATN